MLKRSQEVMVSAGKSNTEFEIHACTCTLIKGVGTCAGKV